MYQAGRRLADGGQRCSSRAGTPLAIRVYLTRLTLEVVPPAFRTSGGRGNPNDLHLFSAHLRAL